MFHTPYREGTVVTLLIAAKSRPHLVVAADGRSMTIEGGKPVVKDDHLQKVFAADEAPLAIANHGLNVIRGEPVGDRIRRFLARHAGSLPGLSVRDVALLFLGEWDRDVVETFGRVPDAPLSGYWFCGFSPRADAPDFIELVWARSEGRPPVVNLAHHGDLLMGGSGASYIVEFIDKEVEPGLSGRKLAEEGPDYAAQLVDRLYATAEFRRDSRHGEEFGGHKHELAVTKAGCRWLIPPWRERPAPAEGKP